MTYTVVTTFHQAGYQTYAARMLQTFTENWPQSVTLMAYAENCEVVETAPNLRVIDAVTTLTDLTSFKERWKDDPRARGEVATGPVDRKGKQPGIGFKWDAIRFANKVYAVCHAAETCETDWLLWMDADTVCHSPLTTDDLDRLCPTDKDLCYLGRDGKYSECGLYALNLRHPSTQLFLVRFKAMYDHAERGIFAQSEWHDSFIFDVVKNSIPQLKLLNWSEGLIRGEGHPLINCEWGRYLDHLKGKRKEYGKSLMTDLKQPIHHEYWQWRT